jgi:hypothetical protein
MRNKFNNHQISLKDVVFLMIILTITSNLFAQKTEYYRHLVFRETPFSDTRGNHQIDKATAQNETHYKFVYDNQRRLVEISHRLGCFL